MSSLQAWGVKEGGAEPERRGEMSDRRGEMGIVGQSVKNNRIKKDKEVEELCKMKGIVQPKMKSFTHPKVVPNLNEFLSSVEHKRRYFEECR